MEERERNDEPKERKKLGKLRSYSYKQKERLRVEEWKRNDEIKEEREAGKVRSYR